GRLAVVSSSGCATIASRPDRASAQVSRGRSLGFIDLKGSTHHPGLLKVLISGNKCAVPSAGGLSSPAVHLDEESLGQPCVGVAPRTSARRSAGEIHPSVCRGRPLSSA